MIIDQNFNLYVDGNYAELPVTHIDLQVFKSLSLQKKNKKTNVCNSMRLVSA